MQKNHPGDLSALKRNLLAQLEAPKNTFESGPVTKVKGQRGGKKKRVRKETPKTNSIGPTLNPASGSSILLNIFRRWSSRLIGSCEVALVESAYLVRCESANNSVKDTTVVKEEKVVLAPK